MRHKRHIWSSERLLLYGYFLTLILIGTIVLNRPVSWSGSDGRTKAPVIDALFTAVSAVCVTGLTTVDTTLWSRGGQWVVLGLIQAGGLGIVTFGMLYLVIPGIRVSLKNTRLLRESFIAGLMPQARRILKTILGTTFSIEAIGALLLTLEFRRQGTDDPVFEAIFHSISAFCNAGFSVFSGGLMRFRTNPAVNLTIMALIISGGIGFMVIRDLQRGLVNRRSRLSYHSRMMLIATPALILLGFAGYMLLDETRAFHGSSIGERILAAVFQSVTTRTAGFNTVDQSALSVTSRWLTLMLMLIGGGSGSTAGGIKVTTALILVIVLFRGVSEKGDVRLLGRRIVAADVSRAAMFFLKAISMLFLSILLVGILEHPRTSGFTPSQIVFECVSALGTVGLSMGITGSLSVGGKLVIAATMFAGRVGLFSLVIRYARDRADALIEYPRGEVLIG